MQSAYNLNLWEFSFTLRGGTGPCHMLDHIWYDTARVHCQAVRDVFRSDEHKQAWPIVLPSLFAMPALDNVWRFFFLSCTVEA
ncbi:ccrn4l [Symbiodinium pilosum]|uniref:Ccrn4l protein n=1 Tax=Symbiodinium pilosum TaxID=2952 RepID=A0A812VUV3_SYMPI|nr:ccrn4l [Symbiodinium pilosum]